jgi:hypothetical protein
VLHDQKLHGIYSCSNGEDMAMRWAGRVARTEVRNIYRISVGISVVEHHLGITRRRKDNIKIGAQDAK